MTPHIEHLIKKHVLDNPTKSVRISYDNVVNETVVIDEVVDGFIKIGTQLININNIKMMSFVESASPNTELLLD